MTRNLIIVRDTGKALFGLGILIGLVGCASTGGISLVASSDDLDSVSSEPRWGIMEVLAGPDLAIRRSEANKKMNTFCDPQKYKVVYERTEQKTVPCWSYSGGYMVSCGDQTADYMYIEFKCAN